MDDFIPEKALQSDQMAEKNFFKLNAWKKR
jgi:hypothetical protein